MVPRRLRRSVRYVPPGRDGSEESTGAPLDAPALFRGDRLQCCLAAAARLHLDERNHTTAPGNNVDFAKPIAVALRQNLIAAQSQPPGARAFSLQTQSVSTVLGVGRCHHGRFGFSGLCEAQQPGDISAGGRHR